MHSNRQQLGLLRSWWRRRSNLQRRHATEYFQPSTPHRCLCWRLCTLDITCILQHEHPHSTTSDSGQAESWDSQPMNLGSSFIHQFTNAGNFTYYSVAAQTTVTGSVNVASCTGNNLQTTGIDIMGGGDDITLNGVVVSGYGLGLAMDGGELHMASSTTIIGDDTAVEVTNVDLSTNGAVLAKKRHLWCCSRCCQ